MVTRYTDARGRERWKGNKKLKASQVYPLRFARAASSHEWEYLARFVVTKVRTYWVREIYEPCESASGLPVSHERDLWADAKLEDVFSWLEEFLQNRQRRCNLDTVP